MKISSGNSSGSGTSVDKWGLRIAIVLAIATAALLLRPVVAHGQSFPDVSVPCAPKVTEPRRAILDYEGRNGIWFDLEVARCMLGRLKALPLYSQRVSLLEQRLEISDQRTALLRQHIELAEEGEKRAVSVLEEAEAGRRRAEEKLAAWYRHPVFLMSAGAIVVVAVEVVAIVVFERISE